MLDYLAFQTDRNEADTVATYDEISLWSSMFASVLLCHIPMRKHIRVLDMGCGAGFPLLELAQRLGSTCTVYGIDPWRAALKRLWFKRGMWNIQNAYVVEGSAEAMPFPDWNFDLIVSNLGVNNFDNPRVALAECGRVARPGARLALTTNLQGHMAEFYRVFESILQDLGDAKALEALEKHVHHRLTVERVTEFLLHSGFRLVKVHEEPASMRFVDGSALLRHYFIKLGFLDAWKEVVVDRAQAAVFTRLEAGLNRLAEERGELSLTIPMAYIEAERVL